MRTAIYAVLAPEPENQFDQNAVAVWVSGLRVGYLSREDAARYHAGVLSQQVKHGKPVALEGVIAGGGMYEDGPGRLGVFLRLDPTDFGVASSKSARSGGVDTGLSEAMLSDENDDSYDLSWMKGLPEDPSAAIGYLRSAMQIELDPLDRHFMYHQLELALYKSRDTLSSALEEYSTSAV